MLLDIELPDAHGITLLDRIRGHPDPRVNQVGGGDVWFELGCFVCPHGDRGTHTLPPQPNPTRSTHPTPTTATTQPRQIPVVVVTAVAMDAERTRCYQHGADFFLTKPIRLATLRDSFVQLYDRRRLPLRGGLAPAFVPPEEEGGASGRPASV